VEAFTHIAMVLVVSVAFLMFILERIAAVVLQQFTRDTVLLVLPILHTAISVLKRFLVAFLFAAEIPINMLMA
jgi:hypothetical protein